MTYACSGVEGLWLYGTMPYQMCGRVPLRRAARSQSRLPHPQTLHRQGTIVSISALLGFSLLVTFIIGLKLLADRLRRTGSSAGGYAYDRAPLFSPAERSFLGVLDQALGAEYRVFGKVRVADVLVVARGTDEAKRRSAFNRISAKHLDFVVCAPDDLRVLCAIELNDASHKQAARRDRDDMLAEACRSADLPLVFFAAKHAYSIAEVREAVRQAMGLTVASAPIVPAPVAEAPAMAAPETPAPAPAPAPVELAADAAPRPTVSATDNADTAPQCPKCSSPMVKRVGKSGERAGQAFWGCPRFPACRGILEDAARQSYRPVADMPHAR